MVVVDEVGVPLVVVGAEEAVVAVEAAAERPVVVRTGAVLRLCRHEVPLAERERAVAVRTEHLRQQCGALGDAPPVVGEAVGGLRDARHPHRMVVATGQQARARRRAQRGRVEVVVAEATRGQRVHVRRLDVGPEAAQLCEADVVEHDEHHVRRALGWDGFGRPPGLRVAPRATDDAGEARLEDRHARDQITYSPCGGKHICAIGGRVRPPEQ